MAASEIMSRVVLKLKENWAQKNPGAGTSLLTNFISGDISRFTDLNIMKLFPSVNPDKVRDLVNKAGARDPSFLPIEFSNYYIVNYPSGINEVDILHRLINLEIVEQGYIEYYPGSPPSVITNPNALDFQGYLDPGPDGTNARYAWSFEGGDGSGRVNFIDIEQGWILEHESIRAKTLPETGLNHYDYQDHGTAVLGVIMMKNDLIGIRGLVPGTNGFVMSQWRPDGSWNTADALMASIGHLNAGDIILLEAQSFDSSVCDKAWPAEIHEAVFQVIRLATALGIIVIEPAGNGHYAYSQGNDLDKFVNEKGEFIFNRSLADYKDSGGIIVGAASAATPHKRIPSSNYGSRVDCYAWGEQVFTAGNLPGYSGITSNRYTANFGGTSSASAIIAGTAIALQSIVEANFSFRLSPSQMRNNLSNVLNGTSSENSCDIDKIGVMPDLKKIIDNFSTAIQSSRSV